MSLIIDCHGHYTTAPKALDDWRNQQIAGIQDPARMPKAADLKISDDDLRHSIETNQLKLMKERGSDITLFSPRASFMAHHIGDFQVSSTWAAICNELCFRVSKLFPDNFVPVAMLPQSPGVDPATCIPELERCVKEYGAVGINLNPDPSGGHWTSPPLNDRHWYPIYEKMLQCLLSHHWRPLFERRHHGFHAVPQQRFVQRLSDAEVFDPAWRWRGALPLGPFSRFGARAEKAFARRAFAQQHFL